MTLHLPLAAGQWDAVTSARPQIDPHPLLRGEITAQTWLSEFPQHHRSSPPTRVRAVVVDAHQQYLLAEDDAGGIRHELAAVSALPGSVKYVFFLGIDRDEVILGVVLNEPVASMRNLRHAPPSPLHPTSNTTEAAATSHTDLQFLAVSIGLAAWHDGAEYCTACGGQNRVAAAGWERHCLNCAAVTYPRTDPCVIVAITDTSGRLLLAHNRAWRKDYASLVAGFMEMGESPEQAVRREVLEEVGVVITPDTEITYVGSQTWPFPRSLMLGFTVELPFKLGPLQVDGVELDWARMFTHDQYERALARGELEKPNRLSIARAMIDTWLRQANREPSKPR